MNGVRYALTVDGFVAVSCEEEQKEIVLEERVHGIRVTGLSKNAFRDRTNLERAVLHSGIKTIGSSAFNGCTALKEVQEAEGVLEVGGKAFKDCVSLKILRLHEACLFDEKDSFKNCEGLGIYLERTSFRQVPEIRSERTMVSDFFGYKLEFEGYDGGDLFGTIHILFMVGAFLFTGLVCVLTRKTPERREGIFLKVLLVVVPVLGSGERKSAGKATTIFMFTADNSIFPDSCPCATLQFIFIRPAVSGGMGKGKTEGFCPFFSDHDGRFLRPDQFCISECA